jgi:hypothetical protein
MKLEIVCSSVPDVKISLILLETAGTKTRKMAMKRTRAIKANNERH